MRIALFCRSLLSDWSEGGADFLRGIAAELSARGHEVLVFEPREAWSADGLCSATGRGPLLEARRIYPSLAQIRYDEASLDLDAALRGSSLVLVHAWSSPPLVRRLGEHRSRRGSYLLLFHDAPHRALTDGDALSRHDLSSYDAVLAPGQAIRDLYLARGSTRRAFVLHEAADVRVFYPRRRGAPARDLVWIGDGGDSEHTRALKETLIRPIRELGLTARFHGVRYPAELCAALAEAGIEHRGYLPDHRVPEAFAEARLTVHVPPRPSAAGLPGVPAVRVFEALASGIPLICAPSVDTEGLFSPGRDHLVARSGEEMKRHLSALLADPSMAVELSERGLAAVLSRHTCAHRASELLGIAAELGLSPDHPDHQPWIAPRKLHP